jgi:hypothetical protein
MSMIFEQVFRIGLSAGYRKLAGCRVMYHKSGRGYGDTINWYIVATGQLFRVMNPSSGYLVCMTIRK